MIRGRSSARPQTGARGARQPRQRLGRHRRRRHQPRRGAAPVLGGLGEPERAAGQRQRARGPRRRRSAASAGSGRSCRASAPSSRATSPGSSAKSAKAAGVRQRRDRRVRGSPRCAAGTARRPPRRSRRRSRCRRRRSPARRAAGRRRARSIRGSGFSTSRLSPPVRPAIGGISPSAAQDRHAPARSASGCRPRARARPPPAPRAPPARPGYGRGAGHRVGVVDRAEARRGAAPLSPPGHAAGVVEHPLDQHRARRGRRSPRVVATSSGARPSSASSALAAAVSVGAELDQRAVEVEDDARHQRPAPRRAAVTPPST